MANSILPPIHKLPEELVCHILGRLPKEQRLSVCLVCKRWLRIVLENSVLCVGISELLYRKIKPVPYYIPLPKTVFNALMMGQGGEALEGLKRAVLERARGSCNTYFNAFELRCLSHCPDAAFLDALCQNMMQGAETLKSQAVVTYFLEMLGRAVAPPFDFSDDSDATADYRYHRALDLAEQDPEGALEGVLQIQEPLIKKTVLVKLLQEKCYQNRLRDFQEQFDSFRHLLDYADSLYRAAYFDDAFSTLAKAEGLLADPTEWLPQFIFRWARWGQFDKAQAAIDKLAKPLDKHDWQVFLVGKRPLEGRDVTPVAEAAQFLIDELKDAPTDDAEKEAVRRLSESILRFLFHHEYDHTELFDYWAAAIYDAECSSIDLKDHIYIQMAGLYGERGEIEAGFEVANQINDPFKRAFCLSLRIRQLPERAAKEALQEHLPLFNSVFSSEDYQNSSSQLHQSLAYAYLHAGSIEESVEHALAGEEIDQEWIGRIFPKLRRLQFQSQTA